MAKSKTIPKGQIEWWINRFTTVATPDSEIEENFLRLTAGPQWTEAKRQQAIAYAIKCHRENQGLYRFVVNGH